MISYKIVSNKNNRIPNPSTKAVCPSDPDYKEVILERLFRRTQAKVDHRIRLTGTSRTGVVKEIIKEYSRIVWHNNRPKFIVVKMDDDGTEYLVGNKQIKLVKYTRKEYLK